MKYQATKKKISGFGQVDTFEVIEKGDHVICAVSNKKILLENLNYWNIDKQEPYFSYIEASIVREKNLS